MWSIAWDANLNTVIAITNDLSTCTLLMYIDYTPSHGGRPTYNLLCVGPLHVRGVTHYVHQKCTFDITQLQILAFDDTTLSWNGYLSVACLCTLIKRWTAALCGCCMQTFMTKCAKLLFMSNYFLEVCTCFGSCCFLNYLGAVVRVVT